MWQDVVRNVMLSRTSTCQVGGEDATSAESPVLAILPLSHLIRTTFFSHLGHNWNEVSLNLVADVNDAIQDCHCSISQAPSRIHTAQLLECALLSDNQRVLTIDSKSKPAGSRLPGVAVGSTLGSWTL